MDSSVFGVEFGPIDEIFVYKAVESFDEAMTKEITVFFYCAWSERFWGWSELGSLAKYSFQIVRSEKRVRSMSLIQNKMDCIIGTAKLQLLQGHIKKATFNQCFH